MIGALAFIVVFIFGHPVINSCVNGLFFIIAGLGMRIWAAGYLGGDARTRVLSARRVVRSGPYRFFSHPLYLGNLLLVAGMLVALQPGILLSVLVLVGFLIEYGLIARAEKAFLAEAGLPVEQPGFKWRLVLSEWSTWLVTGIAYLLILARALVF